MAHFILKPEREQQAYAVKFHVRLSSRAQPDEIDKKLAWSLERMIARLSRQGWAFVRLSDQAPRGPLPVVPVKGFPKRPPRVRRKPGQPLPPAGPDDALWRVSTLPTFGPKAAHLMTDEVDWEYTAIFSRVTITTEYVAPEKGEPEPLWLRR